MNKDEIVKYCLGFPDVEPFCMGNKCETIEIRFKDTDTAFVIVYIKNELLKISVMCEPSIIYEYSQKYADYFFSKKNWSFIICNAISDDEIKSLIATSYELAMPKDKMVTIEYGLDEWKEKIRKFALNNLGYKSIGTAKITEAFDVSLPRERGTNSGNHANDTLAMVGDRVAKLILTEIFYSEERSKGSIQSALNELEKDRTYMVISEKLELVDLRYNQSGGTDVERNDHNKLPYGEKCFATIFEAVIGAMYFDLGYLETKQFFIQKVIPLLRAKHPDII